MLVLGPLFPAFGKPQGLQPAEWHQGKGPIPAFVPNSTLIGAQCGSHDRSLHVFVYSSVSAPTTLSPWCQDGMFFISVPLHSA
jgi:hypothetical protein